MIKTNQSSKKIIELIDFEDVNKLLEGFNQSTGFVTAILDLEGNVLSKSGWRQLCTDFHRINHETSSRCTISDTALANKMAEGEKYHFYECLNGLVDVAVPIVINGEHIANLFSGQFFFEEPNLTFFKKQAEKYAFDEQKYLNALKNVPVVSKEKVKVAMDFLLDMTQMISEITFQKLEQIQLNEALKKSEERSRNALDHLLEGCQIIGFDWRYLYLNNTAEKHNRRPNSELIGNRYMDEWPGIEKTEVFEIIKQTLETRVANHFENEYVFPDGSNGWFDLSIQPVPEGVFILSIDITERKKAELAQFKSEEKYRLVSDNSDDWIYWVAPDGHLNYVSPACERVTGYSIEEFTNRPELNHEIVFDTDKEKVIQHAHISKLDENPHILEYRIVTKTGEIRWISHSCSPILNDNGKYLGRRATNRNITERKLQEEQLYESEFRFSKLYENSPFGMVMADKEFRFKKVNPSFCAIMGYTETELLQFTFKDVTHSDDLAKDMVNVRKLMNKEIPVYKTEKRYIRKDGQTIWGSLTVTSTYDSDGQFLFNLGIIEDISFRKKAEEDLQKSKVLLAETESIGKVGGWEFNIDTMVQTWTDEVYRIHEVDFNFNPNVDTGINFYTPASQPIIEKAVKRVIEEGEPFDLELEIITAKRKLRKVHSIGKADFENRRVYGFFQDITDRKQAEEALMKTRDQLAKIFETSPGIVCTSQLRPDGTVCFPYGGKRLADYFGIPTARLEEDAAPYFALIHPDDLNSLLVSIQESAYNMTPWRYEWRMIHPVNGVMWIEGHSMPVREPDGSTFWHGVATDITERKLAEEKIRELNERISTATNASKVGIWDWDIKNNQLSWDDQMYALYGLKKGEFAGAYEAWLNGLYPDDREFSKNETNRALSREKEYDTEFRVVWPDGSLHWLKAAGKVFFDENNSPIRMVGVNFDITERKQIERSLQESEEKFRKAFATNPDSITITRLSDGMYVSVNIGFTQIFGYTEEEALGKTPLEINMWHNPENRKKFVNELKSRGVVENFEARLCTKHGTIRETLVSATILEFDGVSHILSTTKDITERKQAEEALRESEKKFRNLLESIPLPVTYVNNLGEIVFRNDRFLQLIGYTHDEVPTVQEWWIKSYPDEAYRESVIQTWESALEYATKTDTDILPIEYNITCKDGTERIFIVSGIIIDDNLLITFIDVTDRKKAEDEIIKLNETLEQRIEDRTAQLKVANRELEAFSYSVSHDLRAPLRHINGFVDLLNMKYNDLLPEKGQHYLKVIKGASNQMGTLIDDLLQFSRTGRQELLQTDLDMNKVLEEVVRYYTDDITNRNVILEIERLPQISGDLALLRIVWINLLSNALKFTRDRDKARIKIGYAEEKNEYLFYIRDNGAGFDMQYAHKLFGVFQRLHSKQEFEGTGIGLANVQRIVLRHGGRTWAESELNQGATFYFTLPKLKEVVK